MCIIEGWGAGEVGDGPTVLIATARGVCDVPQTEGRGDEMAVRLKFRIKENRLTLPL